MKRTLLIACCALSALLWSGGSDSAAQPADGLLDLPPVRTASLENGLRMFYIRDELPQVTVVVSYGFGTLYEKRDTAGIAELIAKTISLGGSRAYPGSALHETIDSMGGRLSIESSYEKTVITIKVLERFKEKAFAIAADLALHPNLGPPYLENAKSLVADSIRRKYDDPAQIAFDRAKAIIFDGEGYGSMPDAGQVEAYTPEQVLQTWKGYAAAGGAMIGIASSIGFDEALRLCRKHFSAMPAGGGAPYAADRKKVLERVRARSSTIFFYPKDIPQSTIVLGTVAPAIGYRGAPALEIMNDVLGGGSFTARLMTEIRVKRGLAYAVQSILRLRRETGVFLAFAQVENSTAGEVLGLLKGNIRKMAREKVSGGELAWARNAISNSFIFQFDTPMNILSNYLFIAYNNLPEDYFSGYLARIGGVSEAEVLAEARALFDAGLVTVVVGNESVLGDLKRAGDVVILK